VGCSQDVRHSKQEFDFLYNIISKIIIGLSSIEKFGKYTDFVKLKFVAHKNNTEQVRALRRKLPFCLYSMNHCKHATLPRTHIVIYALILLPSFYVEGKKYYSTDRKDEKCIKFDGKWPLWRPKCRWG
jgi:hypothetical protein